ncbi:MAG TPA: hypothetical protein VMR86_15615 [Myxococcota bacterium]|nr:hypothetical protein [Myxococcota bacterium]
MSATMSVPSIKGTAYNSVHEDLHRMIDEGRVSRDELEAALSRAEIDVFDSKVLASKWYPITTYRKLLALVAAKEAKGRTEQYLADRGWRAAERLKEAGIYKQLGSDEGAGKSWGARVADLVAKVSGLLYNFTRWSVDEPQNPSTFHVIVDDARDFDDECRFTAQGFVAFAASMIAGAPVKISSTRPTPDRIVYTVKR